MRDMRVRATHSSLEKQIQCMFTFGSLEASTRIVAKIRGRLYEQPERDIDAMKEYPTERDQSSDESNARTNPVSKSSLYDHGSVTSLVMELPRTACLVQSAFVSFGGDAIIICTVSQKRKRWGL